MNSFLNILPLSNKTMQSKRKDRNIQANNIQGTKKPKQMFIDFGQKSFNKSVTCAKCNMVYVPTDMEDILRHRLHCNDKSLNECHLPVHYKDSIDFHSLSEGPKTLDGASIVLLKQNRFDSDFFKQMREILVNDGISNCIDFSEIKSLLTCYLCVRNRNIVGCAFIEKVNYQSTTVMNKCQSALDIRVPSLHTTDASICNHIGKLNHAKTLQASHTKEEMSSSSSSSVTISTDTNVSHTKIILGVRLIWVSDTVRRQGVAKSLIDAARRHFYFDGVVSKSNIAFSQPTTQGKSFAFSYCNLENILIYSLIPEVMS